MTAGRPEQGFARVGHSVTIDPTARIIGADRITIGSNVRIDAFVVLSAGEGGIVIGDHVHIAAHAFMAGAARIDIGDYAGLSGRTAIYSSNDDYSGAYLTGPTVPMELRDVHSAPVRIGRHAIVGAGTVILPGVTIGDGAAVGALSLVKHDVPEFAVVVGAPARRIGSRSRELLGLEDRLESEAVDSP